MKCGRSNFWVTLIRSQRPRIISETYRGECLTRYMRRIITVIRLLLIKCTIIVAARLVKLFISIIAALLAQVPDDEITVNAAAKVLAWGPHQAFHQYRQTDDRGHERVSRTLRDAIVAACRACTTVVDGPCSRGFTCDEQASPRRLRRFEHPFAPTNQGLDRPEFEKDQQW